MNALARDIAEGPDGARGSPVSARILLRASRVAAGWALLYAVYRWYYAAGGTIGMLGTPTSYQQWRVINGIAGTIILGAAVLPLALLKAWWSHTARPFLLVLCWLVTVGCVSHAMIGMVQRVSSLAGILTISYPFWETIDPRRADLQALFFNEPWFLAEGLLWAAIAWGGALRGSPRRMWWIGTVAAAVAVSTTVGLLSAFGVIGSVIIG